MEAIILAGGFGTRLRPLTYSRAKSLLPIMNKPMITYLLESLPKSVDKVILAVNYRKNQLEEFFEKYDTDKEIIINDEPEPLGTGGAVKFAESHLSDTFFVLNSDIICSVDLNEMIKFHNKKNAFASISLWPVENVSEFGVVDVNSDDCIKRFVEKPAPEEAPSNLINAGAYLLDHVILDYIEPDRLVSMEKEIFPQIITDTDRFYGFQFNGYWMDIGRIESYQKVHNFLLKRSQQSNVIGYNSNNHGKINNSIIGDNVYIGSNSHIDSSIILDNVKINDDIKISNSVIGENVQIHNNAILDSVVIGDNELISSNSSLTKQIVWTQSIPEGYPKKQIGNVIRE